MGIMSIIGTLLCKILKMLSKYILKNGELILGAWKPCYVTTPVKNVMQ